MIPFQVVQKLIQEVAKQSGLALPTLVAVSKTRSVQEIIELYRQGQKIFGENYVQELIDKSKEIQAVGIHDLEFHFIGRLQRNKVKVLLQHVKVIHSVDSIRLLDEIDQQARNLKWAGGVFVQVNIDGEESKGGFVAEDLDALAARVASHPYHVRLMGLMCIPDPAKDPNSGFSKLRQLRDRFAGQLGAGLSMGMSTDYPSAIANGSTMIRLGSAIFGEREKK